jgi:hypothetical protein
MAPTARGWHVDYTGDSQLSDVTDEMLQQALPTTKPYTVVVLNAGPRFEPLGPDRSSEVADIIWAHGKRNYALHLAGLMPVVCPIADGSSVSGVAVFDASPEDVDRIMTGDPGVKTGVFGEEQPMDAPGEPPARSIFTAARTQRLRAPVLWGVVFGGIQAASLLGFWWLDPATVYALS